MQRGTGNMISLVVLLFSALTIAMSIYLCRTYGGTDLRIREVGSRLMATDHSPYFYKWQPADGTFLLDPNDQPGRLVNGNVVTPATLILTYPLYQLDHSTIYFIWTIMQLLAAAAIILLLFRKDGLSTTLNAAAIIIIGMVCSEYFFYNIERGQMYIFYALAFSLMYRFYISTWKHGEFLSGFVCGLLILFRPFSMLFGAGFLLQWKKKWLLGSIAGFMLGALIFVLPVIDSWQDYFMAMNEYVNENLGHATEAKEVAAPAKTYFLEGHNLATYKHFSLGSWGTTYQLFKRFGIELTLLQCNMMFAFTCLILAGVFFRFRNKMNSPAILFLFGFLLCILAEIFVPAPRGAYNVIQWIFPLSIVVIHYRHLGWLMVAVCTALLLLHHFPYQFPRQGELAELGFMAIIGYCIFIDPHLKSQKPVGKGPLITGKAKKD